MQLACPACGKRNDLETGGTQCPRCGSDLADLARISIAAGWHLAIAARCLRHQDSTAALAHAEQSWSLRHSAFSARLAFLAAAALGDAERALLWRHRANAETEMRRAEG